MSLTFPLVVFISTALVFSFFSLFIPFPVGIILSNIGLTFFDPLTVLAIVGFYFLLGNIAKILVFRHHLRADLFWNILPGSLIGGLLVTYLLTLVPEKIILAVILFFALSYVVKNIFTSQKPSPEKTSTTSGFVAGLATGMLSAVGGPGGTLRGAYLTQHITTLQELNGITASISLAGGIANTIFRVSTWDISWDFVLPLLLLFPILLTLTYFGKSIIDRLNWKPQTIRLLTNGAVLASLLYAIPTLFA